MVGKRSHPVLIRVALILWLASYSSAQGNQTACPTPAASDALHFDGVVNATGTIPFKFAREYQNKKDWYLSLIYNATDSASQWLYPFVSVPDDAGELRGCLHMFGGQNKTSEGSSGVASESCNGVLDEKCYKGLLALGAKGCGQPSDTILTEAQEVCGKDFSNIAFIGSPTLWGNQTCRNPEPPGIDLPDGYTTTTAGLGSMADDDSDGGFVNYDLRTKQSFPFIIHGFSSDGSGVSPLDTQVICLSQVTSKPGVAFLPAQE